MQRDYFQIYLEIRFIWDAQYMDILFKMNKSVYSISYFLNPEWP